MACNLPFDKSTSDLAKAADEKVVRQERLVRSLNDHVEQRAAERLLHVMRQNQSQTVLNEALNHIDPPQAQTSA